jgi:hypothetical protein
MVIKKKVIKSESARFLWVENVNNSDINALLKNKGLFRFKVFDKVEKDSFDVLVDVRTENMIYWSTIEPGVNPDEKTLEFLNSK